MQYSEEIADYTQYAADMVLAYCERHGYAFVLVRDVLTEAVDGKSQHATTAALQLAHGRCPQDYELMGSLGMCPSSCAQVAPPSQLTATCNVGVLQLHCYVPTPRL